MTMLRGAVLAVALAVAAASVVSVVPQKGRLGSFDPARMHLVDVIGHNYLFRGNIPMQDHKMIWDTVTARMAEVAAEQNRTLPENPYYYDISFLNPIDYKDLGPEIDFWHHHHTLGEIDNWPLVGETSDPRFIDHDEMVKRAKDYEHWAHDDLIHRLTKLRTLLEEQAERPRIFYCHCEAGVDRTGEWFINYALTYQHGNYHDALEVANHITSRKISVWSQYGASWYCYQLKYHQGLDVNCDV